MKSCIKPLAIGILGACVVQSAFGQANAGGRPKNADSPGRSEPPTGTNAVQFTFGGGTPRDFIAAIQKQFNVDWWDIVTIPRELSNVQIPRMRLRTADPEEVLDTYNFLGEEDPSLGKWSWIPGRRLAKNGGPAPPMPFVVLVPDKQITLARQEKTRPISARLFPLRGIPETEYQAIVDAIERANRVANQLRDEAGQEVSSGNLAIDSRTKTLIASGPPDYLDLVESSVNTFAKNARIGETNSPGPANSAPATNAPHAAEPARPAPAQKY
jgi:hypothetical protein